jgi:ribosomal protein S14
MKSKYIKLKKRCWKCGKEISVYSWEGKELWSQTSPEEGRPETLKFSRSKDVPEGYWANRCSFCGIIQGDWFLFMETEGCSNIP